jgi:hypothetical protein
MNQTEGFDSESNDGLIHPLHSLLIIEKSNQLFEEKARPIQI